MAGLGLGPEDFALFEIEDAGARAAALEGVLSPKLRLLADHSLAGLTRVAGRGLHAHGAAVTPHRGRPPEEVLVAFSESERGFRGVPFLAVLLTRGHLHARVGVRGESPLREAMADALRREAPSLARRGKPFRRLRQFVGWNHEDLPELAPAHSAAFWEEMAEAVAPGRAGLDLGVAIPAAEARNLALGDLLGTFRDLAPLYKVLAPPR